jgi:hypothetical protein
MTSILKHYAQRDNRLEIVTLTGYITDNGGINGIDSVPPQHPAYAEINLTKAQNFFIDTRVLTLRTDPGSGQQYLLRIYVDPTRPPISYQNFEWTISIRLPNDFNNFLIIQFYNTKSEAEGVSSASQFELVNRSPDGNFIYGNTTAAITMQVVNDAYILKSASPSLSYA